MKRRKEERKKCFSQMRRYIARHLFGIGTAAVVVVVFCSGWPVYNGVAQANDAPADATLTVGQCIGANATIDPLEETLIKEDVIEENLLQTKVTNGMCEDMLAPISDGTLAQKLLAAQNYMQEIKLIERSMREAAADEAATSGTDAKGPDHPFLADKRLVLPRWTVLGATEEGSTDGGGIGELNVEPAAYLQDVVQGQYNDGGGGGGTASPTESPTATDGGGGGGGGGGVSGGGGGGVGAAPGGGGGTGGGGTGGNGTGGVEPSKRQAAATASTGEDDDASIAERLHQKEEAAINAGASVPEAKASARCSTEVEVSDEELKKGKGLWEIKPQMPGEIRLKKTQQVGLLVSPVTKKRFEEIRQKQGSINEKSTSGIGCVELVDRMKAQLVPLDLEGLSIYARHPNDIRELSSHHDTRWGWDMYARQPGNLELLLDLRYAISREGQEFRLIPQSPVYDGKIRVTMLQSGSSEEATERPWWRRIFSIFEGFLDRLSGA